MISSLEQFHHATVITGNRKRNLETLKELLATEEFDVFIVDQESLKIDQLRDEILVFLNQKKVFDKRFVIISVDQFGYEAQNAFLKNLEEPEEGTHIIILVSDAKKLLPTILSRCQVIAGDATAGGSRLDVAEFLKKNMNARFEYIESWTKNKKDEDNVSKSEVVNFIDKLEQRLWQELQLKVSSPYQEAVAEGRRSFNEQLFADIRKTKSYAHIRGASHRILLDFIAIVCPVLK